MRNLRKLTAVVLAVALVLTSMAAAFAATEESTTSASSVTVVNGDKAAVLKELKLYAGTDDTNPAAGLDAALKVQDALIWLATEFGYKAEADKLTDEDATKALAKFADAKDISEYAKKVVAYSAQEGIIAGEVDKAGKLYVRPAASVTAARFATFMLKGLGYDLTGSFTEAVGQLAEVDGSKIDADATGDLTRDAAVGFMYGILTAKTESGKTVAENLLAADSSLQTVLSKNSLLPVNGTLAVDSVKAVANNKVAVTLKEAAAATAADFAIVKKGTTTAVAVKDITKESDTLYVVETDALTGGVSYTLTANGASINFTGIAADTTAPTIVKVTSPDTNTFVVEYSDKMDYATATDVANYTWDKSLKTVKAALNGDRNKVTLTTDVAKINVYYNLTIANVKNSDGKAITKATRNIKAVEDRTAPRVASIQVQNNTMLVIKFEDANGMNKASLETLENYSISDLSITSVKAYDTNDDDKYETVVIKTAAQTANKSYTLTMENLTDNSVLANALGKTTRTFRGASEDKTAPTVKQGSIKSKNNNLVEIQFNDNNAMDAATLEDISNYSITLNNESLEIISAKASSTEYPDAYTTKKVTLTTAAQEAGKSYKLEVKAVADEFGNTLKQTGGKYPVYNFIAKPIDTTPPYVTKAEYVSSTQVKLTFDDEVNKATATDPTNYSFNKDIGSPITASLDSDTNVVTLTTQALTANTTYTITMNNIEDAFGNAMSSAKLDILTNSGEIDTTIPSISYIYAPNTKEIQISFDEAIAKYPSTLTVEKLNSAATGLGGGSVTFTYSGVLDDGKTLAYRAISGTTLGDNNYVIATTTGDRFADAAGNKIDAYTSTNPVVADRAVFAGTTAANDKPQVEYIEQVNVKKLKVTFSEPVSLPNTYGVFTFTRGNEDIKDDYQTEWYVTRNTIFKSGETVTLTFKTWAKDLAGDYALEIDGGSKTEFVTYMEDSVKPVITGVAAVDNFTVEVTYDEDLSLKGTYRITNLYYDSNGKEQTKSVAISTTSLSDNVVTIKTSAQLYLANNYYLVPTTGATDLAGNKEDVKDIRFDFAGSDVVNKEIGKGVGSNNAKQIYVTTVKAMNATTPVVSVVEKGDTDVTIPVLSHAFSNSNKTVTLNLAVPTITGKSYVVTVKYTNGDTEELTFDGNTPDLGLTLVRTAVGTLTLDLNGYTPSDYAAEIVATPGAITVPGTASATGFSFNDSAINAAEYYVILYRASELVGGAVDSTTTVVYAAKVAPEAGSAYQVIINTAETKVAAFETEKDTTTLSAALNYLNNNVASGDRVAFVNRLVTVVEGVVTVAEDTKTPASISAAQDLVTLLPAGQAKTDLQARIDAI
ncbi:Ig-like domain-containing protein [Ruminiclostridium cellobioparum]|uniref:Ig-like domain-containing protein n=1 Tax=Ruminiclostridium cellobioparum TaxID=29355 RepID=UPI00048154F3|nr:Ig-like domain-containing protein [Ruminiclostridium cellobioparum]